MIMLQEELILYRRGTSPYWQFLTICRLLGTIINRKYPSYLDAEPITDFRLDLFDKGEYHKAVEQENLAKNIVEVLYPMTTIMQEKSRV